MPIYEYECPVCGRFEALQKMSEKPLKAKPDCENKKCPCKAERLVSGSAFHLKGSGWYKTDYASSGSASSGSKSSSSSSSSSSESSGEKKADAPKGGKSCGPGCGCH